jgi:class 3 adenylate cyclase
VTAVSEAFDRRLVAVMFTDMVGYTVLIESDEQAAVEKRDRYVSALDRQHAAFGGTVVQRLGDGSMSMFPSSLAAVQAAVAMQQELAAQDVPVRIGVHVGEVVVEPERLTGEAVNIASRIESFGVTGGVMLSDAAYAPLQNRSDVEVVPLGRFNSRTSGGRSSCTRSRRTASWCPTRQRWRGRANVSPACRATCPTRQRHWPVETTTWRHSSGWCASIGSSRSRARAVLGRHVSWSNSAGRSLMSSSTELRSSRLPTSPTPRSLSPLSRTRWT